MTKFLTRLTVYDVFGNADLVDVDQTSLYSGLSMDETNTVTMALNRLALYEDAIERGKLRWVQKEVPNA